MDRMWQRVPVKGNKPFRRDIYVNCFITGQNTTKQLKTFSLQQTNTPHEEREMRAVSKRKGCSVMSRKETDYRI